MISQEDKKVLQEMVQNFVNSFLSKANELDDSKNNNNRSHFHFLLPKLLSKCEQPMYKQLGCLILDMASIETNLVKAYTDKKASLFVDLLLKKLQFALDGKQYEFADNRIENIKTSDFHYEEPDFDISDGDLKMTNVEKVGQETIFNVYESGNGGQWKCSVIKKLSKKELVVDTISVFENNELMGTFEKYFDLDDLKEEIIKPKYEFKIRSYKFTNSINSFFIALMGIVEE